MRVQNLKIGNPVFEKTLLGRWKGENICKV